MALHLVLAGPGKLEALRIVAIQFQEGGPGGEIILVCTGSREGVAPVAARPRQVWSQYDHGPRQTVAWLLTPFRWEPGSRMIPGVSPQSGDRRRLQ